MRLIIVHLLLCTLFTACLSEKSKNESNQTRKINHADLPESVRSLEKITVYKSNILPDTVNLKQNNLYGVNNNLVVGRMLGAVVDKKGRVYIADLDQKCIHVFESNGSFIKDLGNSGRGPGEFNHIEDMQIHANKLYAYDNELKRINVFSLDLLSFLHSIKLRTYSEDGVKLLKAHTPTSFYIQNEEKILLKYAPLLDFDNAEYLKSLEDGQVHKNYFYRINRQGEINSGKIFEEEARRRVLMDFRGSSRVGSFPFYNESLLAVSNDGEIFAARTGSFLIKEYNPNGEYVRAFYYPYINSNLQKSEVIEQYDLGYPTANLSYVKKTELPKLWPALYSMRFDDENRLWIATILDSKKVYKWWILNKSGKLIGRFEWPRDESIEDIRNGYLYTKKYVKDAALQKIIQYKINFKKP